MNFCGFEWIKERCFVNGKNADNANLQWDPKNIETNPKPQIYLRKNTKIDFNWDKGGRGEGHTITQLKSFLKILFKKQKEIEQTLTF